MDYKTLDTRMLLKIILNPSMFLKSPNSDIMGYLIKDDSERFIYVDVIQLIQEHILESSLNPAYVEQSQINDSMELIDFVFNPSKNKTVNLNSFKRVYIHFIKLIIAVNLLLSIKNYNGENLIRLIPTVSRFIIDKMKWIDPLGDGDIVDGFKAWNICSDFENLDKRFRKLEGDSTLWRITVFGDLFKEFPLILTTLNRGEFWNIMTNLLNDKIMYAELQSLFLITKYGVFTAFYHNQSDVGFNKELIVNG